MARRVSRDRSKKAIVRFKYCSQRAMTAGRLDYTIHYQVRRFIPSRNRKYQRHTVWSRWNGSGKHEHLIRVLEIDEDIR